MAQQLLRKMSCRQLYRYTSLRLAYSCMAEAIRSRILATLPVLKSILPIELGLVRYLGQASERKECIRSGPRPLLYQIRATLFHGYSMMVTASKTGDRTLPYTVLGVYGLTDRESRSRLMDRQGRTCSILLQRQGNQVTVNGPPRTHVLDLTSKTGKAGHG